MTTLNGTLSDWQVTDLIGYLLETPFWASLHYSDPRIGVPTAHEVPGAGYHRVQATMTASGARLMICSNALVWTNLSAVSLTHIGIFDDSAGGNLRATMPLDVPYIIAEGAGYQLGAGDLYYSW